MSAILWWIIIGLIVGALAKLLMPGDDPGGIIVTILLGIAGAVLGGWLFGALGIGAGGTVMSIIAGIVGAIILLLLYRVIRRRT